MPEEILQPLAPEHEAAEKRQRADLYDGVMQLVALNKDLRLIQGRDIATIRVDAARLATDYHRLAKSSETLAQQYIELAAQQETLLAALNLKISDAEKAAKDAQKEAKDTREDTATHNLITAKELAEAEDGAKYQGYAAGINVGLRWWSRMDRERRRELLFVVLAFLVGVLGWVTHRAQTEVEKIDHSESQKK